jgi:hypothetical protein
VELIVAAPERQGQVDLAALDEARSADAALFDQVDVDTWSRFQVSRQEGRQHALDDLRRASDTKGPDLAAAHRMGVLGQLVDPVEQLAAPTQEAFSCARQTNSAPGALEEPDAQLHLEVVDLPPQRRLGDTQSSGGPREGARLGDRDEVSEVTELHAGSCL